MERHRIDDFTPAERSYPSEYAREYIPPWKSPNFASNFSNKKLRRSAVKLAAKIRDEVVENFKRPHMFYKNVHVEFGDVYGEQYLKWFTKNFPDFVPFQLGNLSVTLEPNLNDIQFDAGIDSLGFRYQNFRRFNFQDNPYRIVRFEFRDVNDLDILKWDTMLEDYFVKKWQEFQTLDDAEAEARQGEYPGITSLLDLETYYVPELESQIVFYAVVNKDGEFEEYVPKIPSWLNRSSYRYHKIFGGAPIHSKPIPNLDVSETIRLFDWLIQFAKPTDSLDEWKEIFRAVVAYPSLIEPWVFDD